MNAKVSTINTLSTVNTNPEEVTSEDTQTEESLIDAIQATAHSAIDQAESKVEITTLESIKEMFANEPELNSTDMQREVKSESRTEMMDSRSLKSQEVEIDKFG